MSSNAANRKESVSKLVVLSKKNMPKAIMLLAWPIIVEMLLQSTVGIADVAMVGRLSPASIAAVGLGNQFIMFLLTVFAAIRTGVTVLVARLVGANDYNAANNVARQALVLTGIFGSTIAIIGVFFPEYGYKLLGAKPDVIAVGIGYMRYRYLATLFACTIMVITGILRGCGDTLTAMKVNVCVNLINIGFNYLLIFGKFGFPNLGTAGAGAATMIARFIGAFVMLWVLFKGKAGVKLHINDSFKLDLSILKRLMRIGIPAGVEQIFMRGAQILFTIIVTNLGTALYAAHQVALRADSIAFMPGFGFSVAATTLVGQNLGAQQIDEANKAGKITMYMAIGFMSALGLLLFIFAKPITMIFSDDTTVVTAAAQALRIISVGMPFIAISRVTAGALRGAGDTKFVMWGTGASIWAIRLGLAYIFVNKLNMGLNGAWLAMCLDNACRAVIFLARFLNGKWRDIRV